ncbi:MAG: YoaK family protein [Lachnospiraceae bacterium]|nr:YoaK family protein [Lachnospiraceae bacterium]MDD3615401.1 YoaK family protein [Lachnospiraceae bacterium]
MERARQMSESIELGIVLALAGGFMDAYSYLCRDHVFANAQTGNLLLLGVNLAEKNWDIALRYASPVCAFVIGIAIADIIRLEFKQLSLVHWRQIIVLGEAIVLAIVSQIPLTQNLLANSLLSFACGMQVETFRKIRGNGIATTMCIGNLRSATQYMCEYFIHHKRINLEKGFLYYGIIVFFVLGAIIGNTFIKYLGHYAIAVNAGLLLLTFIMMFIDKEKSTG